VITVGFIGYWLIAVVDHKSKNPDSPALNDTLGRAGVVVLVTLYVASKTCLPALLQDLGVPTEIPV